MSETIKFAEQIRKEIPDSDLVNIIKKLSNSDEYRSLQQDLLTLRQEWKIQTEQQRHFTRATKLNIGQWQQRCEDHLYALIAHNQKAISKPRCLHGWLNFTHESKAIENSRLRRICDAIINRKLAIEHTETGLQVATFD